jgi:quercetin dioxygenase-like cupin family protein
MTAFQPVRDISPIELAPGLAARAVVGDRMTLAVVDLEPNAIAPEHHHENEQLGFIIAGTLTFKVGAEERVLHAGDTYTIPSNVTHGGVAGPDGATVCDVFAPIRAEWAQLKRKDPTRPNWP